MDRLDAAGAATRGYRTRWNWPSRRGHHGPLLRPWHAPQFHRNGFRCIRIMLAVHYNRGVAGARRRHACQHALGDVLRDSVLSHVFGGIGGAEHFLEYDGHFHPLRHQPIQPSQFRHIAPVGCRLYVALQIVPEAQSRRLDPAQIVTIFLHAVLDKVEPGRPPRPVPNPACIASLAVTCRRAFLRGLALVHTQTVQSRP